MSATKRTIAMNDDLNAPEVKRQRPSQPSSPAASASEPLTVKNLLDFCPELLLEIFERFDHAELCAVADTCCHLQQVARRIFEKRKITKIYYGPRFTARNAEEIVIESPKVFFRTLRHFGRFIRSAEIGFSTPKNAFIYNALELYGAGYLRALHMRGWGYFDRKVVDARKLFSNLEELRLSSCRTSIYGHIPFEYCQNLTSITTSDDNITTYTFPSLVTFNWSRYPAFDLQETLTTFIDRHPRLEHVMFGGIQITRNMTADRPKYTHVKCTGDFFTEIIQFFLETRILTVTSLRLCNDVIMLLQRNNTSYLEELHLTYRDHQPRHWPNFAAIPTLRILRLYFLNTPAHLILSGALRIFVTRKMDTIKHIEINCPMKDYQYETYQRVSNVCRAAGVSLTIHGPSERNIDPFDDAQLGSGIDAIEDNNEGHIFAYLGAQTNPPNN